MRFSNIGALSCVSAMLVSSVAALDLLAPGHSAAELLVVSRNVTVMTPRRRKSGFDQQLFDFGSARNGFSELKHIQERQACQAGFGSCPNDAGVCCQIGGRCCGGGKCCGTGRWCYASGCCLLTQNGCDNQGCCDKGMNCCTGGSCCDSGEACVIVNGKLGCCPIGQTCTSGPTCTRTGYSPCSGENFCCPTGNICYRDAANNPLCRDPNQATATTIVAPSTTATPPEPSYTSVASQPGTTFTSPEPGTTTTPPTTREEPTQPPAQTTVQSNPATVPQPSVSSRASIGTASTRTSATTSRSVETNTALNSSTSSTNVGAIAGGTVAGIVAIVVLILVIVMWRRKKANNTPTPIAPGPDQPYSDRPAYNQPVYNQPMYNQPAYNQPAYDQPTYDQPAYSQPAYNQPAYNNGPTPPTPGSGDPFLTPMAQSQGLGTSYFIPGPASPGPSGTGSGTGTQYTGLPEPQQSDYTSAGALGGAISMPTPRRDGAQPRPLPMSVTSMQGGAEASTRWSGYADSTPSSGLNATGYTGYPEVESNNSQPRWSAPAPANMTQPDRAPSTVYQPSSHDGGYDELYSPSQSPPPHSAYGGMAPSVGGSGLPSGAAPPVSNFAPGEKHVYRPY